MRVKTNCTILSRPRFRTFQNFQGTENIRGVSKIFEALIKFQGFQNFYASEKIQVFQGCKKKVKSFPGISEKF